MRDKEEEGSLGSCKGTSAVGRAGQGHRAPDAGPGDSPGIPAPVSLKALGEANRTVPREPSLAGAPPDPWSTLPGRAGVHGIGTKGHSVSRSRDAGSRDKGPLGALSCPAVSGATRPAPTPRRLQMGLPPAGGYPCWPPAVAATPPGRPLPDMKRLAPGSGLTWRLPGWHPMPAGGSGCPREPRAGGCGVLQNGRHGAPDPVLQSRGREALGPPRASPGKVRRGTPIPGPGDSLLRKAGYEPAVMSR